MIERRKPSTLASLSWQFAIAVTATAGAFALRVLLNHVFSENRPYITFYLAVVVAAGFGGAWGGMLATIFGGLLGLHYFAGGATSLATPATRIDYGLYFLISLIITLAYETLRRERTSARDFAEALEESQARLRALLENSPSGIYLKDADGKYLLVNKEYARILGTDPKRVLNKTDSQLLPPEIAENLRRNDLAVLMTGAPINIEKTMMVEGQMRSFISTKFPLLGPKGWPIAVGSMSIDVTDRKALEDQLVHSQKMDSIGRLAGGIAHDFNNLLTAIIGYAELAEMRLGADHPVAQDLVQIRSAGERAAKLTSQLLSFARKHVQETREVSLNEAALAAQSLLGRLVGEQIKLSVDLDPDLWPIEGDAAQFELVLVNLVVNARDAISGHGEITMTTRNVSSESPLKAVDGQIEPGDYALISVRDTGEGIDAQTMENIFEPFFTTKEKGKGTGLGLATVYGIIHQHGGQIIVQSKLGEGTTFSIYLPRRDVASDVIESTSKTDGGPIHGTILLAEEDHDLRLLAIDTLQDLGYRVLDATDPADATAKAALFGAKIDLLIAHDDGADSLIADLQAMHPEMQVVGVGYRATSDVRLPYTSAQLANAVRKKIAG